jgi:hypothetical protein
MKALQRQLPFVQQDKDATSVWKASSNSGASGSAIIASPQGGGGGGGGILRWRAAHHAHTPPRVRDEKTVPEKVRLINCC